MAPNIWCIDKSTDKQKPRNKTKMVKNYDF